MGGAMLSTGSEFHLSQFGMLIKYVALKMPQHFFSFQRLKFVIALHRDLFKIHAWKFAKVIEPSALQKPTESTGFQFQAL